MSVLVVKTANLQKNYGLLIAGLKSQKDGSHEQLCHSHQADGWWEVNGLNYHALKSLFDIAVDQLQKSCKCERLLVNQDHSCVGAGSRYPRVDVTCADCNSHACIFQNEQFASLSQKIKRVRAIKIYRRLKRVGGWMRYDFKEKS